MILPFGGYRSLSSTEPVGDGGIVSSAVLLVSSILRVEQRWLRRGTGVLQGGGVCGECRCGCETFQRQAARRVVCSYLLLLSCYMRAGAHEILLPKWQSYCFYR